MEYHNHIDGINLVKSLMCSKRLLPVFGAGFTKGEKANKSTVPDGNKCIEIFSKLLNKYDQEAVYGNSLPEVAAALYKAIRHKRVPEEEFLNVLSEHFTKVCVSDLKTSFLKLPWPFAFTINIDDGINEKHGFRLIMPYSNARGKKTTDENRYLYKLHGDAQYEIDYEKKDNLVFNYDQYIRSLLAESNQSIREAISNAFREFNILFIGCSLKFEPDLKHIYQSLGRDDISKKKNIMLVRKSPSDRKSEELEDDYGITDIIITDDYDKFYTDLINVMHDSIVQEEMAKYKFKNPTITTESDLKYFTGANIFDEETNIFHKSQYYILRDDVVNIEELLGQVDLVFINGRRFSGKTASLCALRERDKVHDVYFFPSSAEIDSDVVREIILKAKNSLFLFDDNSLSSDSFFMLRDMLPVVHENQCHAVVALNRNETYPFAVDSTEYYVLKNKMSADECDKLAEVVEKEGFIRRMTTDTNLDYVERLHKEQGLPIYISTISPAKFTIKEKAILMILAVRDKIYSRDYLLSLKMTISEVDMFLHKTDKLVEQIPSSKDETKNISSYKLVHNSRVMLTEIIGQFGRDDVVQAIRLIVSAFRKGVYDQRRIYKDVMKFDALNQMFGTSSGAGNLIFEVYEKLQDLMADDLHYWLQRSKSIYRLKPNNEAELKIAYQYAKKTYIDAGKTHNQERLVKQAAMSISLIRCLQAGLENDDIKLCEWELEAVSKGYEAIFSDYYRQDKYMRSVLQFGKKNYASAIIKVCDDVMAMVNESIDCESYDQARQIKAKMNSIVGAV